MNDRPRRDQQTASVRALRIGRDNDARRMAPGLREANDRRGTHWVEGNGWAPVGWEPWDYEQQQGYRRLYVGASEFAWAEETFRDHDEPVAWVNEWSLDELGIEMPVYHEEAEDWEVQAPILGRHRSRDWGFEGPPHPYPILTPTDVKNIEGDLTAEDYAIAKRTEAKRQREEDERKERLAEIAEQRRDMRAMRRAAKDTITEKIAAGFEGKAEVHVRKGNQTLRWSYTVADGKAKITRKVSGWVPLNQRR